MTALLCISKFVQLFTRPHVIRMHAHADSEVYHVLAYVCTAGKLDEVAWMAGGFLCSLHTLQRYGQSLRYLGEIFWAPDSYYKVQ